MTNFDVGKDEAFKAMQAEIFEALSAITHKWGPRKCQHGDWIDCDLCSFAETSPDPSQALSEYLLIASFVSMEDGTASIVQLTPPSQLWHHTLGLVDYWSKD